MKVVIMCAGKGERWNNYMGIPKQLVDIGGEKLLHRTIRQINERNFGEIILTVPKKNFFGDLWVREIVGKDDVEIDKFLNAEREKGNTILFIWGDTFFTDEAMDIIEKDKNDLMFFGRKKGSKLTGKKWGELFAVKANEFFFEKAKELKSMKDKIGRCASWELYRLMHNIPLKEHRITEHFTEIDDWTDDFDYPVDYDIWIKNYKNKV